VTAQTVMVWAVKAREATVRRDEAIRAMHEQGESLRAIAAAAGLSHSAIAKIVARSR
jgi:lambda repressor-like predicted transcriptional regulator